MTRWSERALWWLPALSITSLLKVCEYIRDCFATDRLSTRVLEMNCGGTLQELLSCKCWSQEERVIATGKQLQAIKSQKRLT
jgi:hypothetical protein